jgi:hypothetical protein
MAIFLKTLAGTPITPLKIVCNNIKCRYLWVIAHPERTAEQQFKTTMEIEGVEGGEASVREFLAAQESKESVV